MKDFKFYVDDDVLTVKFLNAKQLGRIKGGQYRSGGEFCYPAIRLPAYETRNGQRGSFWHEFGHYVYHRAEMKGVCDEEDIVTLFEWVAVIINDSRNVSLRRFLGVKLEDRKGPKTL